jgi:hypothetical protein
LGRRIEKNVNGTITRYLYDREDILLEFDSAWNVTAKYIHGPGVDEPLAMEKNRLCKEFFAFIFGSALSSWLDSLHELHYLIGIQGWTTFRLWLDRESPFSL